MRFSDLDLYKDLLREKAGLYFSADKSWLLDSRLGSIAEKWGFHNVEMMTLSLRGIAEPGLIKDVIEAMIDPSTSFFRHPDHFTRLRDDILPRLVPARKSAKKLRIWSAGCSTGQEPYSIAMFFKEHADLLGGLKVEIMATDISRTLLDTAQKGQYSQSDIQQGLSVHQLLEHFDQKKAVWHLKSSLKSMVTFQYGNLLDSLAPLGQFDLIFCCNVIDSFGFDLQDKIKANLAAQLTEGGILFLEPREMLDS